MVKMAVPCGLLKDGLHTLVILNAQLVIFLNMAAAAFMHKYGNCST